MDERRLSAIARDVAKTNANGAGRVSQLASRFNRLEMADCFGNADGFDAAVSQTDHFAEVAIGDEFHGGNAKARRKNAVKRRGRASALNVAQHTDTNLLAGLRGDRLADQVANGTVLAAVFL